MKKILIALSLVVLFFTPTTFAKSIFSTDGGDGYCRIDGGGYVQVNYYDDGRIIVSNQSDKPTVSINVTITCSYEEPYTVYDGYDNNGRQISRTEFRSKKATIFSGTIYDFPAYSNTEIGKNGNSKNSVTIKAKNDFASRGCRNFDYTVRVDNPICK